MLYILLTFFLFVIIILRTAKKMDNYLTFFINHFNFRIKKN